MKSNGIARVALLNDPLAAAGDIQTNTGVTPNVKSITGLNDILSGSIQVSELAAQAEVLEVVTVGRASATVEPTIVADQRYSFRIGPDTAKSESVNAGIITMAYRAPAILTGSAAADRHAMWYSYAYRIRQNPTLKMEAYAMANVTLSGAIAVGTLITGVTSGAKGIILALGATENIGVISGSFVNGETLNNTTTGVTTGQTVTTVDTLGTGLFLRDKPGYYRSNSNRFGASFVLPGENISDSLIRQDVAPVYWRGIGTIMLGFKPIQETTSPNLVAGGDWDYPWNADPIAGKSYTTFIIVSTVRASQHSDTESIRDNSALVQILYVRDDATNYAALRTALLALT